MRRTRYSALSGGDWLSETGRQLPQHLPQSLWVWRTKRGPLVFKKKKEKKRAHRPAAEPQLGRQMAHLAESDSGVRNGSRNTTKLRASVSVLQLLLGACGISASVLLCFLGSGSQVAKVAECLKFFHYEGPKGHFRNDTDSGKPPVYRSKHTDYEQHGPNLNGKKDKMG